MSTPLSVSEASRASAASGMPMVASRRAGDLRAPSIVDVRVDVLTRDVTQLLEMRLRRPAGRQPAASRPDLSVPGDVAVAEDAAAAVRARLGAEARTLLLLGGYATDEQAADGGHIHAGRLIWTGGLSVLAGRRGIRSKGKLNVTFRKLTGPPADLIVEHAMRGRSNRALAEIAGRDVMGAPFPLRLLSNVPRDHAEAVAAHLRQQACRVRVESPDERGATQLPDFLEQLGRLAALHDRGVLTDAEFDAEKAEILGSGSG